MNVSKAFESFPEEGLLVGKILVAYTNLEVDLMNCIKTVLSDLDTVLKVMYRVRGETQRIMIAESLGFQTFKDLGLDSDFKLVISCLKFCVKLRNQYAHSIFWNDLGDRLVFSDLEALAKSNNKLTDVRGIQKRYIDVDLLRSQLDYFEYVSDFLMFLLNEGLKKKGGNGLQLTKPSTRGQPELFCKYS